MSIVHFWKTSPLAYEGRMFPLALWIRATLDNEIYGMQHSHGQVRHRSKVLVAPFATGRSTTLNSNLVLSNAKSREEQVWLRAVTGCRVRFVATEVKCEAVPPFRCDSGQRVGRPLKRRDRRAARLQGCQFSRAFVRDCVPGESAVVPRRSERPGHRPREVALDSPDGGPDALATSTGSIRSP